MIINDTQTIANTAWGTGTGEGNTWVTGGIVAYPPAYDPVELRKHAVETILNKADRHPSLGLEAMDDALPLADDGVYAAPTTVHTNTFLIHLFNLADQLVEYYTTGNKPEIIADIAT